MNIGIYTYGKLGRGLEIAAHKCTDAGLVGVFTRREPESVKTVYPETAVYKAGEVLKFKGKIDVLIIAGGSSYDTPQMSPLLAESFNIIDSFDTHSKIPEHLKRVDAVSKKYGTTALISCGWDPGLFSVARALFSSCSIGQTHSFWGVGVSQGHSEAVRQIEGVIDAVQYTVPYEEMKNAAFDGRLTQKEPHSLHKRVCYVAIEKSAAKAKIEHSIKTMPNYFAPYETEVNFVSLNELHEKHSSLPHGGSVIHSGTTGENEENRHSLALSLHLDSNPEFTAAILTAYARAVYRMSRRGDFGAKTVFDISPCDISALPREELIRKLL